MYLTIEKCQARNASNANSLWRNDAGVRKIDEMEEMVWKQWATGPSEQPCDAIERWPCLVWSAMTSEESTGQAGSP